MTPPPDPSNPAQPGSYKSQPWVLFDTVAARSFLWGDLTNGLAVGAQLPAIDATGQMIFFNAPGRSSISTPVYTNLDQQSQLSYGMEVWAIYVHFMMPTMPPNQNIGYDLAANAGVPGTVKLVEAMLNFGVLDLTLGQESQLQWPLSRFGAGGGLNVNAGTVSTVALNGIPEGSNVMKLAEPIQMPRTQNISARIRLAPEVQAIIGTVAAPGVGQPLSPYSYGIASAPTIVSLAQPPFAVQLGLAGRRIKDTQYGQLPAPSPFAFRA
jgi:hypothetical protein